MKHLNVIFMLAFSFILMTRICNAQKFIADFSTTKSQYTIYEGEYVTICLD